MKTITASSPCKLIITGEHAVVYGNPALAVAIEPRCTASLREVKGLTGFTVRTFEITATGKKVKSELRAINALNALLDHFKTKYHLQPRTRLELTLTIPQIKGIGSSASIAAAISKALFTYLKIKPTPTQLFNATQTLENVAHGGKASGIDAAAVLYGAVRAEKRKGRKENGRMEFSKLKRISLPTGCALVVVDTKRAKPRRGTGEMVKLVAPRLAGNKKMLEQFQMVYKEISKQLNKKGDPHRLGTLFNANHTLLAILGTSTDGIELARSIALENGAYGAKITGAGGEGGAIVALVPANRLAKVISALRKNKFKAFRAQVA